jgi:IPT/TIG domain
MSSAALAVANVPTITSISPASGPAGTVVTITGTGFTGATSVKFGTVNSASLTPISDTQIKVASPVGVVGTVDVTVTTPGGTSPVAVADQFNYVAATAPVVTGVSPASGLAGTVVTIAGTGLTGATSVSFGFAGAASFTTVSDSQIRATSPTGNVGTVDVIVVTPGGPSGVSTADQFTYTASTTGTDGGVATTGGGSTPTTAGITPVPSVTAQGYYTDPALTGQLVNSIVDILKTASSPGAIEARNMILRRIALQGDVIGSRIPPPKSISEIGGYMNLLEIIKQPEMRAQALAGILGVAGPSQPLGWVSNDQPLAFVTLANDRPAGPAQPTISLTFLVRSDFSGAFQAALNAFHQQGCALPISGQPAVTLPPAMPGALPPVDVLPYLGRTIDLAPAAALTNPQIDALALVRAQGSGNPFQVASRVLSPGIVPVVPANYGALQCTAASCSIVAIAGGQYVPVAPILATAGFYPAAPLPQPTSLGSTTWARFTNITGLLPGVTKLGDELSLLYGWSTINHSIFAGALQWVWDGAKFA